MVSQPGSGPTRPKSPCYNNTLRQPPLRKSVKWTQSDKTQSATHYYNKEQFINVPSNSRPTSLIRSGHGGWGMMQFYGILRWPWLPGVRSIKPVVCNFHRKPSRSNVHFLFFLYKILSVFWQKIFRIFTGFLIKILSSNSIQNSTYLVLRSNSMK